MSDAEVAGLLAQGVKLQLGTINPDGTPHLVTMFYALDDEGKITFWTYRSSQKARNIERDPRVTCLIEVGEDYFELHGAMLYGTARVLTEPNDVRHVGRAVVHRMMAPGGDVADPASLEPFVEATAAKRWAYVVDVRRMASWDHRKLG